MLCFVTTANVALSCIDSSGNPVAAPAVIDSSKEAIYFSETIDDFGNGLLGLVGLARHKKA